MSAQAATLLSLTNSPPFPYTTFSYAVTADSATEDLAFAIRQDPSFYELTGLSVVALGSTTNLVTNPNFASGFAGYTFGGNTGFTGTSAGGPTGTFGYFGAVGSDTLLSQTINTTVGTTYTVSFMLQNDGGPTNDFTASFGGTLSNVPLPASFPMFGAALVALGGAGYAASRRTAKKAAV